MDYFNSLSNLQLSAIVPAKLLGEANKQQVQGQLTTYYFDSEKYSQPHRITVDQEKKLQEMALTIPKSQVAAAQVRLQALGKPEAIKNIGEQETILAFPSQGLSFSLNSEQKVEQIVIAQPTNTQKFVTENFLVTAAPSQVISPTIIETIVPTQIEEKIPSVRREQHPMVWLYGVLFVIVLLLVIMFFWLSLRQSKEKTSPHKPL